MKARSHLPAGDLPGVLRCEPVPAAQLRRPVGVGGGQGIGQQVPAGNQGFLHRLELPLQPGGQNGQAHDLDQADGLPLDVVDLLVGVEEAQGVLRRGQVVAQGQVQLVGLPPPPGDGGDRCCGARRRSLAKIMAPRASL